MWCWEVENFLLKGTNTRLRGYAVQDGDTDNKSGEAAVISSYWYVQGQNGPREIKSDGVMLFSETDETKGSCWMLKKATHKKGRQSARSWSY
jgi:hypothetical protein